MSDIILESPKRLTVRESIDRESVVPLYLPLEEILRDKMERGEFSEGDLIPSE